MSLTATERAALGLFRERLHEVLSDPGLRLTAFGSKARGDDRPNSDIEVLVEPTDGHWRTADKVYEIATDILLETCLG